MIRRDEPHDLTPSHLAMAEYARHDLYVLTPSYLALAAYARHCLYRVAVDYPRRGSPAFAHVFLPTISSQRETVISGFASMTVLLDMRMVDRIIDAHTVE